MSFWTEKKINLLRKCLKEDGMSFAQAAARLGCTRNMALGKAKRLGIESKHQRGAKKKKSYVKTSARTGLPVGLPKNTPTPPPAPTPIKPKRYRVRLNEEQPKKVAPSSPQGITNIPGPFECKWITGDVRQPGAKWCREPTYGKGSWCEKHRELVYYKGF